MECYSEDKKKELAEKRRELNNAKRRIAEIDGLIQKLYEDNARGKLSDDRYPIRTAVESVRCYRHR